jgi:hypothetical protein
MHDPPPCGEYLSIWNYSLVVWEPEVRFQELGWSGAVKPLSLVPYRKPTRSTTLQWVSQYLELWFRGSGHTTLCRCFGPGGSLDRLVNLSLRAPAQMGWCEMEHKGKMSLVLSYTRVLIVGVTSIAREREQESE